MMKRLWLQGVRYATGLAAAALILAPAAAQAQIRQVSSSDHRHAIGVTLGGFFPKGGCDEAAGQIFVDDCHRTTGDTIVADLNDLLFEIKDFRGASFSGEYLFAINEYLEAGFGAGFYKHTVNSVYRDVVNDDRSEIAQELELRIVPMTATVRFLPIGRGKIEPYVGGGIGAFNWTYSEAGEFVDNSDSSVFPARYSAKGTAVGPVFLGGIRAPIADVWDIGGEVQYQHASGDTKPAESQLLGDKIDLGGFHLLFTMHIRF